MLFDGERFKKAVKGKASQQQVAEKLGVIQQQVSFYLSKGGDMRINTFLKICKATEIDPKTFIE